jgi:hypothetical protein
MNHASGGDDNSLATLFDALDMAGSRALYCPPQTTNIIRPFG